MKFSHEVLFKYFNKKKKKNKKRPEIKKGLKHETLILQIFNLWSYDRKTIYTLLEGYKWKFFLVRIHI